jgi:hypothetical protein
MAKGKTAATGKAAIDHDPLRGRYARWVKDSLEDVAPSREAVVAVAGRTLLRVFPILADDPAGGDATSRELVAASWESLRLAAEASRGVKPEGVLVGEAKALVARFSELTQLYQGQKTSASWSAWSVGTAASRVKDCLWARDLHYLAGEAASEALDALWQSAGGGGDAAQESSRLRLAIDDDVQSLRAPGAGQGLALRPLWPQAFGAWPRWYRRYREWVGHLTSRPDWLTVVAMLDKDAERGRNDPALQQAFDAFDGAKLPRPPLTKLTDLTPAEGMEALRNLARYLERVGEPVAEAVRLLLGDLDGKSFQSFPQTKEFVESLQALLDRIGYAVECPRCEELGRLEAAAPATAAHGSIRVRHPGRTNHGNRTSVSNFNIRKVEPT